MCRLLALTPLLALAACNPLPEGNGLTLSPESPLTDDDLTAYVDGELGDADKVTWTYTWSVDGTVQDDLTETTVPSGRTARGQTWEVAAQAIAGNKEGEVLTASVQIGNTAPVAESVSLAPAEPVTTDAITATPVGSDADGDDLGWIYVWSIDSEGVPGVTGATLDATYTSKGDSVRVTATPADGGLEGEPVSSDAVVIGNLPPDAPALSVTPAEPMDHEDLLCQVVSDLSDPDDDPVSFTFSWTVDGEPWAGEVGTDSYAGDVIPGSATQGGQAWSCVVVATDGTDEAPAVTSAAVTIVPS